MHTLGFLLAGFCATLRWLFITNSLTFQSCIHVYYAFLWSFLAPWCTASLYNINTCVFTKYHTTPDSASTIIGHLLSHPRYSATSIFKDWSVRKLRKFVLESLDDRSGKWYTKGCPLMIMLHWDMMWSAGVTVCFGIFAKELMWPHMIIALVWHRPFSPLSQNIFYTYSTSDQPLDISASITCVSPPPMSWACLQKCLMDFQPL